MLDSRGNKAWGDYQYVPLVHPRSIRLLKILPSRNDNAPIQCTLEDVNLDDSPQYKALSYTWSRPNEILATRSRDNVGQHPEDRWILVDGARLKVNAGLEVDRNLHDFLIQFRRDVPHSQSGIFRKTQQASMRLWVDAVCINQVDITERNAQVGMMARIYTSAAEVIVWLGCASQKAPAVVADIETLARAYNAHREDVLDGLMRCDGLGYDNTVYLRQFGLSGWTPQSWEGVTRFFRIEWFSRVWVCQEFALAGVVHVLWGDSVVSWQSILDCARFFFYTELDCYVHRIDELNPPSSVGSPYGVWQAMLLGRMREECQTNLAVGSGESVEGNCRSSVELLEDLLLRTKLCLATDPRDKIFGLLGVVEKRCQQSRVQRLPLRPDYNLTAAHLYQQVTMLVIQETASLRILSRVHSTPTQATGQIDDLPSWVPNYSRVGQQHLEVPEEIPNVCAFNASRCRPPSQLEFCFDQATLKLKGIKLATVSCLGQSLAELKAATAFEKTANVVLNNPCIYFNGQSRIEAWWRTYLADMTENECPAPAELEASFSAWLHHSLLYGLSKCLSNGGNNSCYKDSMPSYEKLADTYTNTVIPRLAQIFQIWLERVRDPGQPGQKYRLHAEFAEDLYKKEQGFERAFKKIMRILFGTAEGYIGNGPDSLQEQDEIWIIKGSDVPLAVRKLPNAAIDQRRYQLLGEAYVHGVMHGEAFCGREPGWETLCLV
jgi:Heterokaryon incompatibility protein (HET)